MSQWVNVFIGHVNMSTLVHSALSVYTTTRARWVLDSIALSIWWTQSKCSVHLCSLDRGDALHWVFIFSFVQWMLLPALPSLAYSGCLVGAADS